MPSKKNILLLVIVISSILGLFYFFGVWGIVVSVLWDLLLLIATNIDRAVDIAASSYKWGRKVNFWFEKNAVGKRLEVTIGTASKRINQEAGFDLLPHGVEVKWDGPSSREAFLKRGKMVLCLEPSENEERNLARATIMYVQEDLISQSQRFVDPSIMKSLCFSATKRMLLMDKKIHALRCLNTEFVEPECEKNPEIREYISGMDDMDRQGLLTRVILREFSQLDAKLSPALTDNQAIRETREITKLLIDLARKKEGEEVKLVFNGAVFRINFMLVARLETLFSTANFVKAALYAHGADIETIYVLARGVTNIGAAILVVQGIEKAKLFSKSREWNYRIIGSRNHRLIPVYAAELQRIIP